MISVRFNVDSAIADLTDLEKRQLPFAFELAANRTVEEAQLEARTRMYARITIRQAGARQLFERAIRFGREDRADRRKGKLSAELRIIGQPGLQATNRVMARFGAMLIRQEEGGTRTGRITVRRGTQAQFAGHIIPFPGLRTPSKGVPRNLYPAAIGLSPRRAIAGGEEFASQYKGGAKKRGGGFRKGTKFYFATEKGIFLRNQLSNGESEYDALWWFRPRVTLKPRLGFAQTFDRVVSERLPINFNGALRFALRTAR